MSQKPEQKLVEDYLKDELCQRGWNFVEQGNLERESIVEPLLIINFQKSLFRLNQDLEITKEEVEETLKEIKLLPASQDGISKFLNYLKYGIGIKFEKDKVVKFVRIFDFEKPENNEFIISKQISFKGKNLIRTDLILFINGIPLVNIECKNPTELGTSWQQAYGQIKDYEKSVPELYKYVQIGIAAETEAKYFPIVPWQDEVMNYEWKEGEKGSLESIIEFLRPEVLLDILRNFLFAREQKGTVTKVIARYVQYRAANKIYQRVLDKLEEKHDNNKGLIWHWQGSGKTLTMIFAGHKLYFDKKLANPSLFFLVDRRDLEEQMKLESTALKLNFNLEKIEKVSHLKEVIQADDLRGKRGAFLALLHKFNPQEFKELTKKIEEFPKNKETIATRKNIICFLDEVHRTQYGLLAGQMKLILKNAFFFGFTGTPISEDERNTYESFGYPLKKESYLDKYFVDDALEDQFTVPIVWQTRMEDLHLRRADLETFLSKEFKDEDLDIEKKVTGKLNTIKVFLEDNQRIREIVKDIVGHFKENVDGRFKALVVTGSRKACVLYKKALDEHLDTNLSEIVMTFNLFEKEKIISDYHLLLKKKYPQCLDDDKIREEIRESFKEKETPKILIVTDMLLTGFDAPVLQTMYLDKPLKKHRLLQAIARTNRPFGNLKEAGVIVDYVGVLKEMKKALKNYFEEEDVQNVVLDFEFLANEFREFLKGLDELFQDISQKIERENLLKALEILKDEEKEKLFKNSYHQLRRLFELLGTHKIKIEFLDKFNWYSALYVYYLKTKGEQEPEQVERYFQQTIKTIHNNLEIQKLEKKLPEFRADLEYFKKLKESGLNKKERSVSILFGLEKMVLVNQNQDPIYQTIADKVEKLVQKWRWQKIDYEELFKLGQRLIKEIEEKKSEREKLKFSDLEYSIFLILKDLTGQKASNLTRGLYDLISEDLVEDWFEQHALRQKIFREVRGFAGQIKIEYRLSLEEMDDLFKKLTEAIENYGARS